MPACIGCRSPTTTAGRASVRRYSRRMMRSTRRFDQKLGRKFALQRLRVVDASRPIQEGDALGLAFAAVALEERVEDAGLREAEMAVARRRAGASPRRPCGPHGRRDRARRRSRPGRRPTCNARRRDSAARRRSPWRTRMVSRSGAPRERTTNSTRSMPSRSQASFCSCQEPCSRPPRRLTMVRTPRSANQRDLMRRRLRRAPQARRDLVPVEIEQAEDAVVGEQHVGPGPEAPGAAADRPVPARDAGHPPRVADLGL